ncbi:alpha-glucosidase C-terminal domain-containing protein, partial [Enterobacter hormaechei]|nr:alpha-glucosidase C-terminal domain-containing protein [Enterobacter hormaechei]MCE1915114.1 alpha-glucosidase C-terminal domain-containing protein [Enterobacter hormaechei]
ARLIKLRKEYPVLTYGSYEDLLPSHPSLWCYVRRWENQTLLVIANLSVEVQKWSLDASLSDCSWVKLMGNYPENHVPAKDMQLQPYEAVYWLAE